MATQKFCTFYLGEYFFGVDVLQVQEVIRFQKMTRVPLAPYAIRGLMNLRGNIVTAMDLRRRLNMSDRSADFMCLIIPTADTVISLLVDRVGDVLELEDSQFEAVPNTLDPQIRSMLSGVYKLESEILMILHTDTVFELESPAELERQRAAGL